MVPSDTGVVRASVLVLVVGLALYGSLIVSPAGQAILSPKVRRATARAQGAEIVHGLTLLPGADKASGRPQQRSSAWLSEAGSPDVAQLRAELDHLYGKLEVTRSELQRLARSAKPAAPGPGDDMGSHLRGRLQRAKRALLAFVGAGAAHALPTGAVPPLSAERKASASPIAFIKTHKVHLPASASLLCLTGSAFCSESARVSSCSQPPLSARAHCPLNRQPWGHTDRIDYCGRAPVQTCRAPRNADSRWR